MRPRTKTSNVVPRSRTGSTASRRRTSDLMRRRPRRGAAMPRCAGRPCGYYSISQVQVRGGAVEVVGYVDPISVRPGDRARVAVAAETGTVDVSLVRLGVDGAEAAEVSSRLAGRYAVHPQELTSGSSVVVPDAPHLRVGELLSASLWVLPTRLAAGAQAL